MSQDIKRDREMAGERVTPLYRVHNAIAGHALDFGLHPKEIWQIARAAVAAMPVGPPPNVERWQRIAENECARSQELQRQLDEVKAANAKLEAELKRVRPKIRYWQYDGCEYRANGDRVEWFDLISKSWNQTTVVTVDFLEREGYEIYGIPQ